MAGNASSSCEDDAEVRGQHCAWTAQHSFIFPPVWRHFSTCFRVHFSCLVYPIVRVFLLDCDLHSFPLLIMLLWTVIHRRNLELAGVLSLLLLLIRMAASVPRK